MDLAFIIKGAHGAGRDGLEEAAAAAFFFVGDVAWDGFILLVGCRSSPTPFTFSCSKNNFPLLLTPPESLILWELTVLRRSGWRSDGMAPLVKEDMKLAREPGLWMKSPSTEVDVPAMASIKDRTW
jgi:hypothetical protein